MQNNSVLRGMVQIQYDADPNMKTLALEDLLMMPVQRMPRYELLLASLLKTTPRNHADYALLKSAHRLIQGLCASFNANKSEAERRYRETRYGLQPTFLLLQLLFFEAEELFSLFVIKEHSENCA
jgi:hypothetical protein